MIKQCLTRKTYGFDRPRYPVLHMLWGIITSTNVDYAELIWEEFVQAMQTFLVDKANLSIPPQKGKKTKPHVIPYCRFTKLIICHLGRTHNIHQRSASPFHLAEEDHRLENLKFVPKGEGEEYDVERAIQTSLESFQAHVGGVTIQELVAEATRPLPVRRTRATEEASTGPSAQPQDDASANIVRESPSPADAEIGEDVDNQVNLEEKTAELDQGQAGSDPGKTPESRPPPEQVFMDEDQARPDPGEIHVALAGLNPEPTHYDFMANVYPNVHESLKFPADEHVILEDPLSSSGTLSSMKNLDDAYTIRDQFLNDQSTEDEQGKLNVEVEVVSMVTVLIYQASSLVLPLSTHVIDLSPPKPVPYTTQAPIVTATTTTTTTTLPLLPHPQQQSTTDSKLVARVTTLEHKFSAFEKKSKTLDNTTRNLGSGFLPWSFRIWFTRSIK
ncbi:hypothetical protein Tco_0774857 [Tanacetum coccineum]|uniref:Uncharacterized protein n=1 Tax=Tanacetum coccineum TaxID=301880 RepID=A0ABQ4ZS92_9ASTR